MKKRNAFRAEEAVALVIVFSCVYLISFGFLFRVGYLTNDDSYLALWKASDVIIGVAKAQGRLGALWANWPLVIGAHGFPAIWITRIIGVIFLSLSVYLCAFALSASRVVGLLSVLFMAAFYQNNWMHNPVSTYSDLFIFEFIAYLCSIYCFIKYIEKEKKSLLIVSVLAYLYSLGSEIWVMGYLAFPTILYFKSREGSVKPEWRKLSLHTVAVILYVAAYTIWRHLHPSTYIGNKVAELFSPLRILKVIYQYTVSGFPGAQAFVYSDQVWSDNIYKPESNYWFVAHAGIECWTVALLTAGTTCCLLLRVRPRQEKALVWVIGLACVLAFSVNIPVSVTAKYQDWVMRGGIAYLYTFFSFVFFVIAIASIMELIVAKVASPWLRNVVVGIFSLMCGAANLWTSALSGIVTNEQLISHQKWLLMDKLGAVLDAKDVPNNAVIYMNGLKAGNIRNAIPASWTTYVNERFNRSGQILEDQSGNPAPGYCGKFSQALTVNSAFLAFSRCEDLAARTTSSLTLLNTYVNQDLVLTAELADESNSGKCSNQRSVDSLAKVEVKNTALQINEIAFECPIKLDTLSLSPKKS